MCVLFYRLNSEYRLRKIASILLMVILFFNLGGYRILLPLMQDHADRKLESLIDNHEYDESELVEIRVALNLPYQQRYTEYERHYGEIEIDGNSYTYVKSRVEGDVVIFKCIANASRQTLKNIHNDLARANSGADMPGPSRQQSSFAKNALSDYDDSNQFDHSFSFVGINNPLHISYLLAIPQVVSRTPHEPPEFDTYSLA